MESFRMEQNGGDHKVQNKVSSICSRNKIMIITFVVAVCLCLLVAAIVLAAFIIVHTQKPTLSVSDDSSSPLSSAASTSDDGDIEFKPADPWRQSRAGSFAKAAVAATDGVCSEVGRDIMIQGGNAVDGAVATIMCVGVASPQSSGFGGGMFMTIYKKSENRCIVIDAREVGPGASNSTMYKDKPEDASLKSWLAIAVPGFVHGLWTAFSRYGSGKVNWSDLVQPSIELLDGGFPVQSDLAEKLRDPEYVTNELVKSYGILYIVPSLFRNAATGKLYVEGDLLKNERLLTFLKQLAASQDPVQLFYNSEMTQSFVEDFQRNGGIITREDMRRYESKVRTSDVLYSDLGQGTNLRVCGPPPPSGAAFTMSIINTMMGYQHKHDAQFYHRFIESSKFAYAARTESGDSDFVPSALKLARNITSTSYGNDVRAKIQDNALPLSEYGGKYNPILDQGTTHISVMDNDGNAVSLTSSINTEFGSGFSSSEYGFLWNNEMDDFSKPWASNSFGLPPSPSNYAEAGKRMQSSMSPIIVYDSRVQEPVLAIGGVGGSRIISSVAYATSRVLGLNETIREAVDAPRMHNQLIPAETRYEDRFPQELLDALKARGQKLVTPISYQEVMALYRKPDTGRIFGVSDFRKGPTAFPAGY